MSDREAQIAAWREHSITLNRVMFDLATALGLNPEGLDTIALDPSDVLAEAIRRLSPVAASQPVQVEVTEARKITLDDVYEASSLTELLAEARSRDEWCCEVGCGSGGCESCPCCAAGWCVSGRDGLPDDPDDLAMWLEVARDHNPVAAALSAALGGGE